MCKYASNEYVSYIYVLYTFQGSVESVKMALGGSLATAGLLIDCPFQGDSAINNAGKDSYSIRGTLTMW